MSYQFIFLTPEFYSDYSQCYEIEQKPNRPHLRLLLKVNGITFAIPFRSNISHPNAFLTNPAEKCGLDFSKAVVIENPDRYIDANSTPQIRKKEFDALKGKERIIEAGMLKYIRAYEKAQKRPDIPRNAVLLKFSTLQYFPNAVLLPKE